MITDTVRAMLIRWGWIDYAGREKQWYDWCLPLRFSTEGARSGRIQSSKPNFTEYDKGAYAKRNYGKDDKEISSHDRRPSSQSVRPSNRGSRFTGQRTDQGRRGSS